MGLFCTNVKNTLSSKQSKQTFGFGGRKNKNKNKHNQESVAAAARCNYSQRSTDSMCRHHSYSMHSGEGGSPPPQDTTTTCAYSDLRRTDSMERPPPPPPPRTASAASGDAFFTDHDLSHVKTDAAAAASAPRAAAPVAARRPVAAPAPERTPQPVPQPLSKTRAALNTIYTAKKQQRSEEDLSRLDDYLQMQGAQTMYKGDEGMAAANTKAQRQAAPLPKANYKEDCQTTFREVRSGAPAARRIQSSNSTATTTTSSSTSKAPQQEVAEEQPAAVTVVLQKKPTAPAAPRTVPAPPPRPPAAPTMSSSRAPAPATKIPSMSQNDSAKTGDDEAPFEGYFPPESFCDGGDQSSTPAAAAGEAEEGEEEHEDEGKDDGQVEGRDFQYYYVPAPGTAEAEAAAAAAAVAAQGDTTPGENSSAGSAAGLLQKLEQVVQGRSTLNTTANHNYSMVECEDLQLPAVTKPLPAAPARDQKKDPSFYLFETGSNLTTAARTPSKRQPSYKLLEDEDEEVNRNNNINSKSSTSSGRRNSNHCIPPQEILNSYRSNDDNAEIDFLDDYVVEEEQAPAAERRPAARAFAKAPLRQAPASSHNRRQSLPYRPPSPDVAAAAAAVTERRRATATDIIPLAASGSDNQSQNYNPLNAPPTSQAGAEGKAIAPEEEEEEATAADTSKGRKKRFVMKAAGPGGNAISSDMARALASANRNSSMNVDDTHNLTMMLNEET